ncbi:MAG: hypothetical protein NT122_02165 [Solirubrobacterales bacterium]|nr:hypothetical protein [Solirubrobacterales bacterium]
MRKLVIAAQKHHIEAKPAAADINEWAANTAGITASGIWRRD